MAFRVTTSKHVFVVSTLITALAVAVPTTLVALMTFGLPTGIRVPALLLASMIPLLISFPISWFALNMLRTINQTVDAVNNLLRYDPLTGVLCRSFFYQQWRESRRKQGFLAIIDADHFKSINDTHGHDVGDDALKHIANTLTQTVGGNGMVGRLGGEEFCIYLPHMSREQARLLMAQLCNVLRTTPFHAGAVEQTVTVSIGLTVDPPHEPLGTVIKRADQCLYQAKHTGRDRCVMETELEKSALAA